MDLLDEILNRQLIEQIDSGFTVTVTEEFVKVEHTYRDSELVRWEEIQEVKFINTDKGPLLADVWLVLAAKNATCFIPQGVEGFEQVYNRVSKFKGFNFSNVIASMTTTDNAIFHLWPENESGE